MGSPAHVPRSSEEKLRRLQAVADAALSQLGVEDLLAELLDRTRDLLDADTAAVLLLDSAGAELVATAASGLEEELKQAVRLPVGVGFAGTIAATGRPITLETVDKSSVINPILIDKGIASMLGVPMISDGRVIGVLHIGTMTTRQFRDDDVELLQLVAERASHAVQARLSRLDRAATLALQRSLLPGRPPAVAGLDVAARYLPGTEIGVGGDWYDLFTLPSGQIGLAIGDVVGSGLRAAVVMGRIRSALRAYALESADPADVLTRLDRKIQLFEPEAMATAIYAAIDVDHEALTMSSAGHLPPIIVEPDQPARLVDLAPDLPLGAHAAARRHSIRLEFPRDTALFLYTDGLVERRDRPIAEAVTALMAALVTDTADEMCTSAVATLVPDLAATDDIALLAIRRN